MNKVRKNEVLFDALLKISLADALEQEIAEFPSIVELNRDYKPSLELDKRINALIDKSIRTTKLKRNAKRFGQIAACICIILTVSSVVLFSVSATRNAIMNAIIQWKDNYSQVEFVDSNANCIKYRPSYLPSGYQENLTEKFGNTVMITFANEAGEQIIFSQWPFDAGTSLVDSENTSYTETHVSGEQAFLFEAQTNEDSNILIWQSNGMVFEITSNVESGELKLIGESLKK